jgi:UDP-3-O-acyl N-acetylglucosamine deacetylase
VIKQTTIKYPVEIKGVGLQTGVAVKLAVKSAPANSGVTFIRTDLPDKPSLNIQAADLGGMESVERRTTLGMGPLQVQTTEHLLAALAASSIDNIVFELDNIELPGLDGSAAGFADALKKAGITEQDAPKKIFKVEEPVWAADSGAFLAVFPDKDFRISYTLFYDHPWIGTEFLSTVIDRAIFEKEIAPARTFCMEAEAAELIKRGLGKGANYDNTLVVGKDGPINTSPRFRDEPVRHKILDLIGDLYLLGMPLVGHVVAIKSGHKLNMELVKKLKSKIIKN